MSLPLNKTQNMFEQAQAVMPWGVSSNFRYWGQKETPVIVRGRGGHIWDADGNEYIDFRLGYGPLILGHCDERVTERVAEVIRTQGTVFAHTHPLETAVAERIIRMCPGVEKVRFANSGTEATMHALRIARAFTGREKFIKIEGQYHGFQDHTMFSMTTAPVEALGPRDRPIPVPASTGLPAALAELVLPVPYNDFEVLEKTVRTHAADLAAILFEPVFGSLGSILPAPGWMAHVRSLCDEFGIVMIIDDVKCGFRVAPGGSAERFGVSGDLVTFAKAMANGFPLAAIGGRREVMDTIEPGKMEHGGTYCGNLVGLAAAEVTLELIENGGVLQQIERVGQRLWDGIHAVLVEAGVPHVMSGLPGMFSFLPGLETAPLDYRQAMQADFNLYKRLSQAMRARGVAYGTGPSNFYLCQAHDDADVDRTLSAMNEALREVL